MNFDLPRTKVLRDGRNGTDKKFRQMNSLFLDYVKLNYFILCMKRRKLLIKIVFKIRS